MLVQTNFFLFNYLPFPSAFRCAVVSILKHLHLFFPPFLPPSPCSPLPPFSLYGSLALSSSPSIFPSLLPNFLHFRCSQATIISPLGFCTIRLLSLRANLSPHKVHFPQSSQSDILNTKSDHASKPPILTTFQWLPCAFRLKFKLLIKVSKALQGLDPACPFDIVSN